MIGKKQSSRHENWLATLDRIEEIVPRADFDRAFEQAVARVNAYRTGAAYAWSGGKDSMVLQAVVEAAGVRDCCFGMTSGLEYRAFLQWVTDNMPAGLTVIKNGWDLEWLARNPGMLFPANATIAGRWFKGIQHAAQDAYFKANRLAVLVIGRRVADGNQCGPNGYYRNAKGIARLSPLWDWSHELVLAGVRYLGLPLAPFYAWPRGYQVGTHAWPARQWCRDEQHGWSEVHSIDPAVIVEAARLLPGARRFLDSL